jgi:hypothetical protein
MLQNPIIQTLILFLGSYTFMTVLKKYGPVGKIVTIVAGVFCVVIWMLRYNRAQVAELYRNPLLKHVIDLVCSVTKEPSPGGGGVLAPVAASAAPVRSAPQAAVSPDPAPAAGAARPRQPVSARSSGGAGGGGAAAPNPPAGENPYLLVRTDVEYLTLAYRLKEEFVACDEVIDGTLRQNKGSVRMRERSQPTAAMPPLGMNLYMGRQGLGKKSLAIEIGRALYGGDAVGVLDLAERGASLAPVVAAARGNGYQTFIIENVDSAPHQVQTDLLTAFTGQSLADGGALVSFRNCFFFLLVHKEAESFPKPVASTAGTGFTVVVNHLAGATEMDQMLALSLHGVYPFRLPEPADQARVIAHLMEYECNKYNLSLGRVDARVLAREVEEVGRLGNFRASTARVSRILSVPISKALADQSATVTIGAALEERAQSQ